MTPKAYSVSQISRYLKGLIEDDVVLAGFFMEAEISGFKPHSSGHWYFAAKDETAVINCVMFKLNAGELGFLPENGMRVIMYGRLSVYEKTGHTQFYAEMMEPLGVGALHTAFEQLKRKLAQEGLFAQKRAIPKTPACIAVITSPTGAVIRDIISVCSRRAPNVKIVVVPTAVQGAGAAAEIAAAVEAANEWGLADVLILARGGGSAEDLQAFNEEGVARAVFASKIPVISAVGHETDFTIADFTADLRAPTPSAAAELAVPNEHEKAARTFEHLNRAVNGYISAKRRNLEQTLDNLHLISPLNVLKRGYSMACDSAGAPLVSIEQAKPNDEIKVVLCDGELTAKILTTAKTAKTAKTREKKPKIKDVE